MVQTVKTKLAQLGRDNRGQDFVEYALLTGLVATSATAVSGAVAATATQMGGSIFTIASMLAAVAR